MVILFVKIQKILQIFYNKYKKPVLCLFLILFISSLGIFVFGVGEAEAGPIDSLVKGFLILIGYALLGVLWLVGQIMNAAAGLISGILAHTDFTSAAVVIKGWEITRDLANMFFVLILLIIAFATILRIETYGMKQILWKLIVAALLINFSLVFCGVIIDFSQILTQFFIDESGGTQFTVKIAAALNLSKIVPQDEKMCSEWNECNKSDLDECRAQCKDDQDYDSNCEELCYKFECKCTGEWTTTKELDFDWGKGTWDTITILMGLLMSIIFSVVALFAFSAFAFFLIVRILAIWFLLILAPIVWLLWILPATKKHFTDWWSSFIKWVFFAPIYMFFVYLALKTFQSFLSAGTITASDTGATSAAILPAMLSFKYLFQFFLVIGFLLGGLMVAQKMSIAGAGGAIKLGKGMAKGVGKWSGRLGMRAGLKMAPPSQKQPDGGLKGGWVQRGLAQAARIPIAGKLITPAIRGLEKTRAVVEKQKESIKGWSSQHMAGTFNRSNAEGKVARMMQLHENNSLDTLNPEQLKKGLTLAQRYGQESKLVKAMPSYAGDIGKSVQDTINKINPEASSKIVSNQIDDEKVQNAIVEALSNGQWTSAHLGKIANDNPELRVSIQRKIITKENVKKFAPPTKDYLKSYLGNALYDTPPEWLESEKPEVEFSTA